MSRHRRPDIPARAHRPARMPRAGAGASALAAFALLVAGPAPSERAWSPVSPAVASPPPAPTQLLPDFEVKHHLRYRFPEFSDRFKFDTLPFRTTIRGSEVIHRGQRQTGMNYDAFLEFGLAATSAGKEPLQPPPSSAAKEADRTAAGSRSKADPQRPKNPSGRSKGKSRGRGNSAPARPPVIKPHVPKKAEAEKEAAPVEFPVGAQDVRVLLTALKLHCRAGKSTYSILLDETGLTENRPATGEMKCALDAPYADGLSPNLILAMPGVVRMENGAILEPPAPPPMLATLDVLWMFDGVTMMLPPLPTQPVEIGRTWQAGIPVRLSIFALPQIVRFDMRLDACDEETGVAEISWKAAPKNVGVKGVPGIHHIGADAVAASTNLTGRLRLDTRTGAVLSSEFLIEADIAHARSSETTVKFAMKYELAAVTLKAGETEGSASAAETGP